VLGVLFAAGDTILTASKAGDPRLAQGAGVGVIALGVLAIRMRREPVTEISVEQREASAQRSGHWLFLPALLIPLLTLAIALLAPHITLAGQALVVPGSATLIGLATASIVAAVAAIVITRQPAMVAPAEGRRLLDAMGWAALLPLVLATLGGVFAASGVGDAIAALVSAAIPIDSRVACVLAFGLGMVLFTVIMGNAFAAFPVMAAAIGVPLLIQGYGGDPAVVGAIGMLAGFCGTLMTPMAANFNLVPAALLELKDQYGVIRAQVATALPLLAVNIVLIYWLAFR
jgi:uncharacterized membrane protein